MKKRNKGFILLGTLCISVLIMVFYLENNVFKDRTISYEREENRNHFFEVSSEITEGKEEKNNILYTNNVSIEILSCEMIEDTDIESQITYKPEWFKERKLPDAEYVEEYIDYETIKEVCPELRDIWESDNHTIEETKEIYNRNLEVIEQYTTMRHPKTRYFFLNCRITNLMEEINETSLKLDIFIASEQSEYLAMYDDYAVYFDKAVHTNGEEREKSFFWYTFEEGEVLECVLGYEIKEEWDENEIYYLGVQTVGEDNWTLKNTQLVPLIEVGD